MLCYLDDGLGAGPKEPTSSVGLTLSQDGSSATACASSMVKFLRERFRIGKAGLKRIPMLSPLVRRQYRAKAFGLFENEFSKPVRKDEIAIRYRSADDADHGQRRTHLIVRKVSSANQDVSPIS